MKRTLRAFVMCQSMFCALPLPCRTWDESARPRMPMFLPVIGLEIGLLWALLAWGTAALGFPPLLRAALLCVCPYLLTGCIHLDGFLDTADAVGSYRTLERRREILRDPHVGSFAVVGCVFLILTQFACLASADGSLWILLLIPAVSRCCSALAVTLLPAMDASQYAAQKREPAAAVVSAVLLCLFLAAGFIFFGKRGFCLAGALAGYGIALWTGFSALKGVNGDIAGFSLTLSELCALLVCALI